MTSVVYSRAKIGGVAERVGHPLALRSSLVAKLTAHGSVEDGVVGPYAFSIIDFRPER